MLIIALCLALVVGGAVGAVVIRAAVDMHNRVAAENRRVIEPKAGDAFGIGMVLIAVVQGLTLLVGWLCSAAANAAEWGEATTAIVTFVLTIPVVTLAVAGMLRSMLKTTFGRALSVTGIYFSVSALVGIFAGTIVILSQILLARG
jgi:hypothetical protein